MAHALNRQWRVARYPIAGEPITTELFTWTEEPLPEPGDGEFLVRTICLAPGPAQRGYIQEDHRSFAGLVPIGEVMRGRGVGQILASRHPDYEPGQIFLGSLGWQDYSIQQPRGSEFVFSTKKMGAPVKPLSTALGILGQAGATAYLGLLEVGEMGTGDAVLVSAAAGGVGSVAGQIARIRGARVVVGTAGTDQKCRWLVETLGYSHAVNYRTEDVDSQLSELLPEGADVFFDNVGGDMLDLGLGHLAMHARVVICGYISTDYAINPTPGPANYKQLLHKRARMEGFVNFDYWGERYWAAEDALRSWYQAGQLVNCEDVDEGLEKMPNSLASLFAGDNTGIKICRVAPDPDIPSGD